MNEYTYKYYSDNNTTARIHVLAKNETEAKEYIREYLKDIYPNKTPYIKDGRLRLVKENIGVEELTSAYDFCGGSKLEACHLKIYLGIKGGYNQ